MKLGDFEDSSFSWILQIVQDAELLYA